MTNLRMILIALFMGLMSYQVTLVKDVHAQSVNGVNFDIKTKTLTATSGNSFSAGDLGFVNSAGTVTLTNAANASTASGLLVMATESVSGGGSGVFRLITGEYTTSGLTPGAPYYLSSTTPGAITATAPSAESTIQRVVGFALNATTLVFGPTNSSSNVVTGGGGTGGGGTIVGPPVFESLGSIYDGDGGTFNVTEPADIEDGNVLLQVVGVDYTTGTSTITKSAGFTDLEAYLRANGAGAGVAQQSFYKVADGESGTYEVVESAGRPTAAAVLRFSGVDPDDPIDISSCSSGTTEPITAPSVDVTVDDAYVIRTFSWDQGKTVVLAPVGVSELVHVDNSTDLWVGGALQASSGASGTAVFDVSSDAPWVACTIVLQEPGAIGTGGGGGGGGTEGSGPFSLADDGTGNPINISLPIACDGTFVGSACEIFPSNYIGYDPSDPDLLTYSHPTYFKRDPLFYTFCSPNTGATTATASNGRSELRYLFNQSSGVSSRQYVIRFKDEEVVNGLKSNNGQLHRGCTESSPVYKGTYTHTVVRANTAQAGGASTITLDASADGSDDTYNGMGITITSGTGVDQVREISDYVGATKVATVGEAWDVQPDATSVFEVGNGTYRILSKKVQGGSDFSFDIGLGDKVLLDGLTSNSYLRIKREYDIDAETLSFWASNDGDTLVETELTGAADVVLTTVVLGSGSCVYEKDGMYMNNAGDGSNTTPYCVQYWQGLYTGP